MAFFQKDQLNSLCMNKFSEILSIKLWKTKHRSRCFYQEYFKMFFLSYKNIIIIIIDFMVKAKS